MAKNIGVSTGNGFHEIATKDANGVLKVGDIIIPQEVELFSGEYVVTTDNETALPVTAADCEKYKRLLVEFQYGERIYTAWACVKNNRLDFSFSLNPEFFLAEVPVSVGGRWYINILTADNEGTGTNVSSKLWSNTTAGRYFTIKITRLIGIIA